MLGSPGDATELDARQFLNYSAIPCKSRRVIAKPGREC